MDIKAYRQLQDSGWVREQRDQIGRGETAPCPVAGCGGVLEPFDVEEHRDESGRGIPTPGGVRCARCGARSRPVAL